MRYWRRYRRGQSLVEFALAVPLLAVLLLGVTEFGFVLYAHVQVANAAREAARAGSLYLSGRFHYSGCIPQPGIPCPTNYGNGGDCWPIRTWIENALVQRQRGTNGCPATGNDTTIHAFGNLLPTACGVGVTSSCWELSNVSVEGTTVPSGPTNSDVTWVTDRVGKPLKVELVYRYEMPFVGSMMPVLQNPVEIKKAVIMRIQNN
jgi:hypothetical protein